MHVSRNIANKVRINDRKEIVDDFKSVYKSNDAQCAQLAIESFTDKWKQKYPKVCDMIQSHQHLITFYDFPKSIWRSINSTNLIEGFNKQVKRYTKRKEQFPNEDSLDRFLVTIFEEYNYKFSLRSHNVFKEAQESLTDMFKN